MAKGPNINTTSLSELPFICFIRKQIYVNFVEVYENFEETHLSVVLVFVGNL